MRGTHVFGRPFGRLVSCRSGKIKGVFKGSNCNKPPERCLSSSNQNLKLFSDSSKQQDLRRFLEEIGTDPREARYWLRQFQQHESTPDQPFAVVQVDSLILNDKVMLEKLASCLAFLHRNGMPVIIVHGLDPHSDTQIRDPRLRRAKLIEGNIELVDLLEKHGSKARPFMSSGHVLSAMELDEPGTAFTGKIYEVDVRPLQGCLRSGHIPVLTAVAESPSGQVLCVESHHAAVRIAEELQPMKVMFLNTAGGLVDRQGNVVGNVNVADDLESLLQQPWYTETTREQVVSIAELLNTLPMYSSAVITSADSLITELFTHNGSGTMFLRPEKIVRHQSLETVDIDRLKDLLVKSFDKPLNAEYFSSLKNRLHTLYVTESYSTAAVITNEDGLDDIPYMDKFTVGRNSQGLGTSDNLWKKIKQDFSSLFWRSRGTNRINPWYFIRSDGSWTNGKWTVFWYGVNDHILTHKLVQHAIQLPPSFDPIAPHDEASSNGVISSNGYHKYL